MILKSGISVRIFSNGIMKDKVLQYLKGVDPKKVNVILNVNNPESYSIKSWKILNKTMKGLNKIARAGYTIHDRNFNGSWLISLIRKYNLKKVVRLGLAAPLADGGNKHLSALDHGQIGKYVVSFSKECDKHNIRIDFDCGFRLCSFTKKQIGQLYYDDNFPLLFCKGANDINIDLTMWRCFATSGLFNASMNDFNTVRDADKYFNDRFKNIQELGAEPKCRKCKHFIRKTCHGGCIGYALRSFKKGIN